MRCSDVACLALALVISTAALRAELPEALRSRAVESPLKSFYLAPTRIVWASESGVEDAESLLRPKPGQAVLSELTPPCTLRASSAGTAGVLLDFGTELQGFVELFTPITASKEPVRVRIRLGESASEAMAELGGTKNAQNDHALRDEVVTLPWLGKITVGPSGFRFCTAAREKLRTHVPDSNQSKQAAALLVLSGLQDAKETSRNVLQVGGAKNVSTFYGYYVLEALAQAGDHAAAERTQ